MKRRELFKMFATLATVPFVSPLVALCKTNSSYVDTGEKYKLTQGKKHIDEAFTDGLGEYLTKNDDLFCAPSNDMDTFFKSDWPKLFYDSAMAPAKEALLKRLGEIAMDN